MISGPEFSDDNVEDSRPPSDGLLDGALRIPMVMAAIIITIIVTDVSMIMTPFDHYLRHSDRSRVR